MTFNLSVSTTESKVKPDFKVINYKRENITIEDFIQYIKDGRTFCYNFKDNGKTFNNSIKKKDLFEYTNIVAIDVDDSMVTMDNYVSKLNLKPTISYTTISNGVKGYRFRLIYIFNDKIDINSYENVYFNILSMNGVELKDNCMKSVNQCFYGNGSSNVEIINNDVIYNLSDITSIEKRNDDTDKKCNSNCIIKKEHSNIIDLELHFDKTFLDNFYNMSYNEFLSMYKETYPFFQSTPIKEVDEDTPYILLPDNYIEIKRYWLLDITTNDDGERIRTNSRVRRLKDGDGRRKKLFINGILRRFMIADLSIEYILTMLTNELYYYINNTKDVITKKELVQIAINVYKADLKQYEKLSKQKHPDFIVNDAYCIKYGVNRRQARNISRKHITYNKIGELYDCSLTDKENLQILKDNDIDVSLRTLKSFKQDNGLTRQYNRKCNSNCIIKKEHSNIIDLELHFDKSEDNKSIENDNINNNNNNIDMKEDNDVNTESTNNIIGDTTPNENCTIYNQENSDEKKIEDTYNTLVKTPMNEIEDNEGISDFLRPMLELINDVDLSHLEAVRAKIYDLLDKLSLHGFSSFYVKIMKNVTDGMVEKRTTK